MLTNSFIILRKKVNVMTETRKEYNRTRKNLLARIRRMKKAGYEFPENIVPNIPKRVTEGSIRRLKRINLEKKGKKLKSTKTRKVVPKKSKDVSRETLKTKLKKRTKPDEKVIDKKYYPSIDIIAKIREAINSIAKNQAWNSLRMRLSRTLMNVLEDTITYYGDDNLVRLREYFTDYELELFNALMSVEFPSEQEQIMDGFYRAYEILNVKGLSDYAKETINEILTQMADEDFDIL